MIFLFMLQKYNKFINYITTYYDFYRFRIIIVIKSNLFLWEKPAATTVRLCELRDVGDSMRITR